MSDRNYWTTLRQRKISRRAMLGASAKAGVGAAGLALVGCGDDDDDAGAMAAERAAAAAEEAAAAAVAAGDARAAESEADAAVAAEAADAAAEAADAAGEASDAARRPPPPPRRPRPWPPRRPNRRTPPTRPPPRKPPPRPQPRRPTPHPRPATPRPQPSRTPPRRRPRPPPRPPCCGRRRRGREATAAAAQAAIDAAAEAAAAAAAAAGEASAAAAEAAATAQETAEAAAETAAAAVAAAQEAADAAREAAESAAMAAEEEEAPATGPQHGGILSVFSFDGGILDPAIADHGGLESAWLPIYDHINYLDNGGVLTAAMAELPEVVDELTFVYNIKPNVHWQDKAPLNGRQFVAEDAAFGLQRFGQDNPEFIWRDRFSRVDQYEVPDELTLRLRTKEVFAPLLSAVGENQMVMISRDAVEAFGDDGIASDNEAAIGTGGMQYVSREPDVLTVLERNPNYFRDPLPYIDGLRANWNADGAYRAAQYVAGAADFTFLPWLGYPAENEALRAQVGEENLIEVPMNAIWSVSTFFHTQVEPYTDPRVRLALHLAADREQNFAARGGLLQIGGPICHAAGPYAWSVDELRQRPGYRSGALREEDLAEGRRLLDASGYDPGSVPPMTCSHLETLTAEVLHQNFAEIGFEVELQEIPDVEHNPRRAAGDFSLAVQGLGGVVRPRRPPRHPPQRRRTELRRVLGPRDRRAAGAGTHHHRRREPGADLRRDPDQAARRAQSPDLPFLGPAGRRTPSLAQGLRPNQHANRLHLSVVPVVVRGQARHLRRLAGRTSPPAWEPHPLTPSPAKALERGDWRGKGGSRTAPTGSRSLSIALRWRGGTWLRRRRGAPRGRPDSARQGDHKGRPD